MKITLDFDQSISSRFGLRGEVKVKSTGREQEVEE